MSTRLGRWAKHNNYIRITNNKFHRTEVCFHIGYMHRSHRSKADFIRREVKAVAGGKPYREYQRDYVHYKREERRGIDHMSFYLKAWTFVRSAKVTAKYFLSGKGKW